MKNEPKKWFHHMLTPWKSPSQGRAAKLTPDRHWMQAQRWADEAGDRGERQRVYCAPHDDIFDRRIADDWRTSLWMLPVMTPELDWLLLTKEPKVMKREIERLGALPNMWLGVSVEDRKSAEERISELIDIEATVRFLKCRPSAEPLELRQWLHRIDWVIVDPAIHAATDVPFWIRSLRDQCVEAKVPLFLSHGLGGGLHGGSYCLDGREWDEVPVGRADPTAGMMILKAACEAAESLALSDK